MTFQQLTYVVEISKCGSINKAANKLFLSQSGISAAIRELEEELGGTKFVRVSNSEIVNLDRVAALDLTLAGTIKMTLEGGTVCWVSRRYVKKIRQALGL